MVDYKENLDVLLIDLYESRIGVLKSTLKSADINKKKKKAWEEITTTINANDGRCSRTVDQIKARYKNMYNRAKSKLSRMKSHSSKTGGGEHCPIQLQTHEKKILELFGDTPSFNGIPGGRESTIEGEPSATFPPEGTSLHVFNIYFVFIPQ